MPWNEQTKRRLKLRSLDILIAVAETGSMGKAADRMRTSQPAVSKAMADLESAIGVRLVDRSRSGVELTPFGRALIRRSTAVFDELRQGIKDIEHLSDPTAGEVRLGATERIAGAILTPVIDRLSRRHPRMLFHVVTGDSRPALAELNARNVEFVIHRLEMPGSEEHITELLFQDDLVVVTGARNPLARRRGITLADLMEEPWVLVPPSSYAGSWQMEVFRAAGLPLPRLTVEASSYVIRTELLTTQRFFTITTRFSLLLPRRRPELKILPIELRAPLQPIGVVALRNRSLSPAAQMFIDEARELTKPLRVRMK